MQNLNLSLNCYLDQFHFMDFYRLVEKMSVRVTSFISRLLAGKNKVIITDLEVSAAGVKITNFLGSVNIQHDPSYNCQCDLCILDQSAYASGSKYPWVDHCGSSHHDTVSTGIIGDTFIARACNAHYPACYWRNSSKAELLTLTFFPSLQRFCLLSGLQM